jgi:hypothetical protein
MGEESENESEAEGEEMQRSSLKSAIITQSSGEKREEEIKQ